MWPFCSELKKGRMRALDEEVKTRSKVSIGTNLHYKGSEELPVQAPSEVSSYGGCLLLYVNELIDHLKIKHVSPWCQPGLYIDGLMAIVITDRDGVPIFKVATEQTPDLVLKSSYLGTFGTTADQASKLGMKRNKSIVCMYDNHQVVQINKASLLVTFIASSYTNTGVLLDMDNCLKDILQDLQKVVT